MIRTRLTYCAVVGFTLAGAVIATILHLALHRSERKCHHCEDRVALTFEVGNGPAL